MGVKASESVTFSFTTQTPSTGAATDADGTPTGTFRRNGTNDGAVTVTVTNIATGDYKAAFTMPAGASEGDECEVVISATVGGVTGKAVTWRDTAVSKLPGDFNDVSQADITGGAYAIDTDANGRVRLVVGTGTGEVNSSGGKVPATLATADVSGNLPANIKAISDDTTAADNAELFYDGTGYNAANSAIGTVATATTIGATGLAAIWNRLTSALTTSGSIGKLIVDKLGLITSTTTITASIVSDGDLITIYQGETRTVADGNAITLSVSSAVVDLTGYTPKFGLTKITTNSGTATLEVSGTVTDAGTTAQAVVFALTSAQTAALALDPTTTNPFQQNPANSRAYRWTISATDSGSNCPTLAAGYASVKARDTTC